MSLYFRASSDRGRGHRDDGGSEAEPNAGARVRDVRRADAEHSVDEGLHAVPRLPCCRQRALHEQRTATGDPKRAGE